MIVTTLGALAAAEPALGRLAAERLPVGLAYRIAKLAKLIADETRHFYDLRNALVREYGERPPDGGPDEMRVVPGSPQWAAFVVRAEELAAYPVELALDPLDLAAIDGLTMTAADLVLLDPFVTVNGGAA